MLRLLCLALCIAAASAQGCCGPDRWEGYVDATTGYAGSGEIPNALMEHASIHYDMPGKKFVAFIERYDENKETRSIIRILDNFNTMRRMEVEEGACTITELTHELREPCTPPDAEYIHSYYVGVSGESLELDIFDVPMERPKDSYHLRVNKDCAPFSIRRVEVSESPETEICKYTITEDRANLTNTGAFAWYSTYHGIKEGIADESVFETPRECEHVEVNPKVLKKHDGKDIISAFFHKI